ncbi:DUF4349 domain-containing protein [Desulfothermobacter acidiphilus]|uniref:DUF4349 domain-containing protein n=1 Tax=Desulfothermobacter acidiphilus TaxID=1938353 RepID=UPI003F8A9EF9
MRCQEVKNWIWENEAPSEEVRQHLEVCPTCRQLYCLWQKTRQVLVAPPPPAPTGFKERVMLRVQSRPQKRDWKWRWLALAAAGVLALCGSAWAFYKSNSHFLPPTQPAQVATNQTPPSETPAGSSLPSQPGKTPSSPDSPAPAPESNAPRQAEPNSSPDGAPTPAPSSPPPAPASQGGSAPNPVAGSGAAPERVFLSHTTSIRSSVLRFSVSDLIVAQGKVETLARQFSAQEVSRAKASPQVVVLQFLVPESQGQAYIDALTRSGLGNLLSQENSSRDVTQELVDLQARCAALPPSERVALEQEMQYLREAAGKYTVTVCLVQET